MPDEINISVTPNPPPGTATADGLDEAQIAAMASSIVRKTVEELVKPFSGHADSPPFSYVVRANTITAEMELNFKAGTVPNMWVPAKTQEEAVTRLVVKAEYGVGYETKEK